ERLHLLVMVMFEGALLMRMGMTVAVMVMVMPVIMVVVVMLVVVTLIAGLQEVRLDVQDAIEIEGAPAENLGQRQGAAHRVVQLGVGIYAADARLDLGQLVGGDKVGLVDDDHVRE